MVIGSGTELMALLNVQGILIKESLLANGLLTMIKEQSTRQPVREKNSSGLKTKWANSGQEVKCTLEFVLIKGVRLIGRLFFILKA